MRVKLGDIFEIGSGGTPSKLHPEYYNGNIPWVKTGDLKAEYLYEVEDYITEEGLINSSAKLYEIDTVLVAMYGATIGATSILKMPACTNQACAAFRKNERVVPEYLYYFLKSQKSRFVKDGVGGAQPNISARYLKRVQMELLSIDEQKAIVNILDKVTNVINKREEEIQFCDNLVKARFVEMFGDPVKMIADGKTELVENLTDEVAVGFVGESTNEYVDNGIPYLRMQNIRPMKVISDNLIYINEEFHKKIRKAHVFTDDVVISRVGINRGMTAVIPPEYNNSSIGNAVIIRKSEKFNSVFLSAYITYVYGQHTSIGYSKGSAQGAISVGLVKKWPIIKANISLQNQFADFFEQVNKSKVKVQKALDETQKLFDSLMQQYFG